MFLTLYFFTYFLHPSFLPFLGVRLFFTLTFNLLIKSPSPWFHYPCAQRLYSSWCRWFSVCEAKPRVSRESCSKDWVVLNSTLMRLPLCTILVFILCPCQDVIAEDTREGLPSCPSELAMVTRSYSYGALQICKSATSPSLSACWPET